MTLRFRIGIATFVLAFAIHLVPLAMLAGGANPGSTAAVAAATFALNKIMLVASAAILGRDGFNWLKGLVFGSVRRYVFQSEVGPVRHAVGLVLFCVPIVLAWVSPYLEAIAPAVGRHTVQAGIAGDLMLLASLFVLGGGFWEKLRALFVRDATAVLPGAGGGR